VTTSLKQRMDSTLAEWQRLVDEWHILYGAEKDERVAILRKHTLTEDDRTRLSELDELLTPWPSQLINENLIDRRLRTAVELLEKAAKEKP